MSKKTSIIAIMIIALCIGKNSLECIAQNTKIDSLIRVLANAKLDTSKARLYYNIAILQSDSSLAMKYSDSSIYLSKKLNFHKLVGFNYIIIGNKYLNWGYYQDAKRNYENSYAIFSKMKDKINILTSEQCIAKSLTYLSQYQTADSMYIYLIDEYRRYNKKELYDIYNNQGVNYFYWGKTDLALESWLNCLNETDSIVHRKSWAGTHCNIGNIYSRNGNNLKALKYYFKSLRISEDVGQQNFVANNLRNIGTVYQTLKEFEKSNEYIEKALRIDLKIHNTYGVCSALGTIGQNHQLNKQYQKALDYHKRSLYYAKKMDDPNTIAGILSDIGSCFQGLGDIPMSITYQKKSVEIRKTIGDDYGLSASYYNLANDYHILKEYDLALEYTEKSILHSRLSGGIDREADSYQIQWDVYKNRKQFQKALIAHERYTVLRDSSFNEESTRAITRLEMNYEFESKEIIAKAEQDKKDAIATEQIRRKNQQRNAFIGGFALTLGLAGVSYRSYRRKKRDNTIITAQKEVVEKKNHAILESIEYARKLQEAVLPPPKVVKEFFSDSFLLYLPRDIVSGDFYWMENLPLTPSQGGGNVSLFALGDCTGHGVPGAMLSVMGLNGLNHALNELHITQPADFLTQLTKDLHDAFQRSDSMVRDGMDLSICALDSTNCKLTYAGANNPLWIARNGEIIVHKPNKRPVGHHDMEGEGFSQITIDLQAGDTIYLMTDGYADQLGGPNGLKMMTKVFRERLTQLSTLPLPQQREQLIADLDAWKGSGHQTDDVCVMGVRIS